MYPYIDLGFYRLPTFWLINIIGVLVCALMLFIRNKDFSFLNVDITNAGAIGICGAVVGAKVLFALTIIPVLIKYREYYFSSFEIFFTAVSSGAVFYGGLILFIIVINWYLNRYSINKKTSNTITCSMFFYTDRRSFTIVRFTSPSRASAEPE